MATNSNVVDWKTLMAEVGERLLEPRRRPLFVVYFFAVVLLLGSIGVWWSLLGFGRLPQATTSVPTDDEWAFVSNLATYFIALAAATFADAHLKQQDGSRTFRFVLLVVFIITILLGLFSLVSNSHPFALKTAWTGTGLSLVAWWVSNATNPSLKDDPPADAPTGGDVQRVLPGSLANIEA